MDGVVMRRFVRLAGVVAGVALFVGGAAFGAESNEESAGRGSALLFEPIPSDAGEVDWDATLLRRLRAEPTGLNPLLMFSAVDAEFEYLLWDRPFVIDEHLRWKLNPAVAVSYEESADHLSAVLELREGLLWQDGAPFTSEDIAFSWARIMDDRAVCRKARTNAERLAGCDAIDARKVRFRFKEAMPTNKWNVDFPIIAKHLYEEPAAADPTLTSSDAIVRLNRSPIGNGPYRFVEWIDGQRIVLERWEDYPGPKPAFRRVVFRIVPDANAALLAFEAGELVEMSLSPQQYARETDTARFANVGTKTRGEQWTTYYIGWNVSGSSPFLADVRVRRALSYAVNTPLIIERVFFGLFTPSRGLFHPGTGIAPPDDAPYPFDLAKAATLLDDAGWRRDELDGWRYLSIDGKRVRAGFTLNLVQGSETSPRVADIYQEDLKKIGVEMTTRVLEWGVFNERNVKHEFEAYLSAWTPGPEPDEAWNLFHSDARTNGRNYVGFSDPRVDELFAKARGTFDEFARLDCFVRIGKIVFDDAPYTFLVNAPTLWAFRKDVRGVMHSPRGPTCFYPGMLSWWKPTTSRGD